MAETVDPYRFPADREPPAVIDFRHFSPWWPVAVVGLLTLVLLLTSHRVSLHCERAPDGSGFCQSLDEHAFWLSQSDRIDLGGLRGAQIARGNKGATRVSLIAQRSTVELTGASESTSAGEKSALVTSFMSFLGDRSAKRFDACYGSPWAGNLGALFFILPFAGIFALFTRRVRVVVDGAARQVRVQRSRFPLAPSEEDYEMDQVRGAEVEESRGSKGGTVYRVALILAEGTRVPLTPGYTSGRGRKERAVVRIQEALRVGGG